MKVIAVDNFGRETIDDKLIADSLTEIEAKDLVESLNRGLPDDYPIWHRAVPDNYELHEFDPNK